MSRPPGRPPRQLPPHIGLLPDDAVAYLAEQRGEALTANAVRKLRDNRGIPPASEPYRSQWFDRRGIDAAEWSMPDAGEW